MSVSVACNSHKTRLPDDKAFWVQDNKEQVHVSQTVLLFVHLCVCVWCVYLLMRVLTEKYWVITGIKPYCNLRGQIYQMRFKIVVLDL